MKKWILLLSLIVLVVFGIFIKIYVTAIEPVKSEEQIAIAIAEKKAYLKEVDNFHIYNGLESVDVVEGTNRDGEKIIVWIPEKSKDVIVKNASNGLTKAEAIRKVESSVHPKKIIAVRLAMEKNIPLWEIYYLSDHNLINYYYLHFQTGAWMKKIENL